MRHLDWFGRAALAVALLAAVALAAGADDKKDGDKKDKKEKTEPDVAFVPSPPEVVDKMLEVAKITDKDVVYDLGCGDGRIVIAAAKKYKCKAIGIDIDPARIKECEAAKAKVEDKDVRELITFEKKDLFDVDLSKATVVTLYLLPDLNEKLIPQLKKLPKGARIVSHAWPIKGTTPDKGYPVVVKKGGLDYDVYLWTTPLKFEEKDKN
jgi:SAM-dependent methyltransferase